MISSGNFQRFLKTLPGILWPLKTILIKLSVKHGKGFKVGSNVILYNFRQITIGDNVYIGDRSTFEGTVSITIGNNVLFGPEVMIRGGDHNISHIGKPMAEVKTGGVNLPITIEDDVWIGTRVIILKGATIREGAVVGAGSLVNKEILPYTICVGVPAVAVKSRFSKVNLEKHLEIVKSKYSIREISELYLSNGIKFRND